MDLSNQVFAAIELSGSRMLLLLWPPALSVLDCSHRTPHLSAWNLVDQNLLLALHFLFPKRLAPALEILDNDLITKVECEAQGPPHDDGNAAGGNGGGQGAGESPIVE